MANNKLFSEFTNEELEKFEKNSNGIIVFNNLGENAISLQCTDNADVILYVDKTSKAKSTLYPETFLLEPKEISKLYNFFAGIINTNPETYKIRLE